MTSAVNSYFETVLIPQLGACGLSRSQEKLVVEDIRNRLNSILKRWHDIAFRRPVLLLGLEEAGFLEPSSAALETRALVVVAIRNSMIEDLGADQSSAPALQLARPVLSENSMALMTRAAIVHFQKAGLSQTSESPEPDTDWFGPLAADFPRAWQAISQLANVTSLETTYQLPPSAPPELPPLPAINNDLPKIVTVVQSGMDPTFDAGLLGCLTQIKDRAFPFFFCDSFKGLTRNPRKLFQVVEYVLSLGVPFVTHNYYLGPEYASRRQPLLRPFHLSDEAETKLSNQTGVSKRHGEVLALIKASL